MKTKILLLFLFLSAGACLFAQKKIVILHTNDTHSQIEPLPMNDRYDPGKGGVVNRLAVIDSIRRTNENVLLFDAGDIVQGTPYYTLFKGRIEAEAMNAMKYDAGTIGNHEFDFGLDTLRLMFERMNFPIVCSNYDFSQTVLKDLVRPYLILHRFGLKIGILAAGIEPEGLIQKSKYEGMVFHPITETVNKYAKLLKKQKKCDLVICLTHIGYDQDTLLATQTRNIDFIIGAHSHTFLKKADERVNADGKKVLVLQTGAKGVYVGKLEIELEPTNK